MSEAWRPAVRYEGLYEVSDQGRVRSLDRRVRCLGGSTRSVRGRVLRPVLDGKGYPMAGLYTDGKHKNRTVHSLVAEAFIGPREDGMDVDHIDRDKANNRLDNLRYLGHGENCWRDRRGKRHNLAKLTEGQVLEIRRRMSAGGEYQEAVGKDFEVGQATISDIVSRTSWKYLR